MAHDVPSTRQIAVRLLASAYVAAALAATAPTVMSQVAALRVSVTSATTALDVIRAAPLLTLVATPAAVAGTVWLTLAPGLLLAAAAGWTATLGHWLTAGLATSVIVVSLTVESVEAMRGAALMGAAFAALVAALATTCAAAAWLRPSRPWTPDATDTSWWRLGAPFAIGTWLLLVALFPKFFFEAFNGDGAHTFEATRLLMVRAVPFFNPEAGMISAFPGMNSVLFVYPGSWFMRLFGVTEAAVRLPFLLYLAVLGPAVLAAASTLGRPARAAHAWLVSASLAVYAVVLAYSATYDPYSADIALPATQDTCFLVLYLGMISASIEHRPRAVFAYALLAGLCSQAAAAMTAFWLVARWLADPAWRPRVWTQAGAFIAAVAAVAVLGRLLPLVGVPSPGAEHDLVGLLKKSMTLQVTDVRRLVFVLVPAGLYPVLTLPALKRRDPIVDAMALLFVASFGLYYVMAYYSLHYFVPSMVLVLLLFWRTELGGGPARGPWFVPLAGALAAVALLVSLPQESGIYTATRDIGRRIDVRAVQGYETMAPVAFAHADDLHTLFPKDIEPTVPETRYGGSAVAFHAYAHMPDAEGVTKAYAVTPSPDNGPWHIDVLDADAYARDRVAHPRGSRGSPIYAVPRDLLFMRAPEGAAFPILDLRPIARRLMPTLASRP